MKDIVSDINMRIASRVRELRTELRLSLDELASRSGVSRSMISVIERGESSPTAVVLDKLAAALGVTLAILFDAPASVATMAHGPVARRNDQPEWRDPASGYTRRNLSPPAVPQPIQLSEVRFPARARVAFDNNARKFRAYQQIWLLEGTMDISFAGECHRLRTGDCLAMALEGSTLFYNPAAKAARYLVAITKPFRS